MIEQRFESAVPTSHWHALADGRVQCDLCPRFCKLHEGQRGLCFVRGAQDGAVVLTTWGRSSGFCVDPIEKKPLNHFLPGTPVLSFGTAGCNLACKFCFHPDTLVATSNGMRRIEDLFLACAEWSVLSGGRVGWPDDLWVWTRTGTRARVSKVFAHDHSGGLLSIKASCCPSIRMTANHRVFAVHRSAMEQIRKLPAAELSTDHYLIVPKRHAGAGCRIDVADVLAAVPSSEHCARPRRFTDEELISRLRSDASSAEIGRLLGYHPAYVRKLRGQLLRGALQPKLARPIRVRMVGGRIRYTGERSSGVPPVLDLDPDLAWLLGFYCAEGSVSVAPGRPNSRRLLFSCGPHEAELIERTERLMVGVLDAVCLVKRRRTTVTVECGATSVARLFEGLCGSGALHKHVPAQIAQAQEPVIRGFLEGYFAGDGYKGKTHVVGGTVSRELALGLFELGLHLDLLPSFFVHQPEPTKQIEGRTVVQRTTYIVKFKRDRYEDRVRAGSERATWRDCGTYFLAPIRAIDQVAYSGPVYNLEVEDPDHSYLAPFLAVSNCQNWDISKSREWDTLADAATPAVIVAAAERLGCRSVAFTYNDPVIFHEYAIDVAEACRARGIQSVAVTAGYQCAAPRAEFYACMDAANVDLKAFSEDFYWKITGSHLAAVLETLVYLKRETRVWFELTTLLIPGLNDSEAEIEAMTQWVVGNLGPDVPMHFTAFHPDWKMRDVPPTPPATLKLARAIARRNGVRYAYTGNVHDEDGGSTLCHACGQRLIGRDWYVMTGWNLDAQGRCAHCGAACAGVFEARPGTWGARRLPVRLAR